MLNKVFKYYTYKEYINIKFIISLNKTIPFTFLKTDFEIISDFREKLRTWASPICWHSRMSQPWHNTTSSTGFQSDFSFLLHTLQKPIWNPHFREPSHPCSDLSFYTLTSFLSIVQYFYWATLQCSVSEITLYTVGDNVTDRMCFSVQKLRFSHCLVVMI